MVFCLLLAPAWAETTAPVSERFWLDLPDNWQPERLSTTQINERLAEEGVALSGGVFWHVMNLSSDRFSQHVVDFRNSSVIGRFEHWVLDADGRIVARLEGGIQNTTPNPYFLRHGRNLTLPSGQYQIITRLDSPFFLAQPEPTLFEPTRYQQSIKVGNAVTMAGMGIFFALGFYYIVLGTSRGRIGDLLYAVFIAGNLLYNSAALMVASDLFGIHQFFLISVPILFSNTAYIAFVMVLLNINRHTSRILFYTGCGIIALFMLFWIIALIQPHWSLELDRIGVGVFAIYGFTAGVVRVIQGNRTARFYLIANIAFVVPALISIRASTLPIADTLFIEHLGLFAVAVEVILLSLVISHQVGMVYREKEAGLYATQEALLAANHALETKERFLANVSHELRTPLNAIQGSVELVTQHPLPSKISRHIEAIHASSNFLLYLINDILDLAKMNADQLTLVQEPFDLDLAVDDLSSIYKNSFQRDRVRFLIDIAPDVPNRLVGDENRLKQVLANLLSNAFKFTEQGEVRLTVRRQDEDTLSFEVSDTGIGIESDKLHTVFSAFTQADASIARKYGGTGLGLQIASKLVRLMGGRLEVNSRYGEGSRFHFRLQMTGEWHLPNLPNRVAGLVCVSEDYATILKQDLARQNVDITTTLSKHQALAEGIPKTPEAWLVIAEQYDETLARTFHSGQAVHWLVNQFNQSEYRHDQNLDIDMLPYARTQLHRLTHPSDVLTEQEDQNLLLSRMRIAAVDDNTVNLKVLLGMLKRLEVQCSGYEHPREALERIQREIPDMVLMDVQMPIIDGLEATRELRRNGYPNPIIAFTANASDHDLEDCLEAGMDDVLVKPIRLDDLKTMLLKWSDKVNARSERLVL